MSSLWKKWFAHKAQVSMHLEVHTGDKPFGCSRCKKKNFSLKDSLEMHLRMQPGEKPFCCSLCKKWLALYFKTEYFLIYIVSADSLISFASRMIWLALEKYSELKTSSSVAGPIFGLFFHLIFYNRTFFILMFVGQVDWHNFVVVETVDYQPWEIGNFPPPTNPTEVTLAFCLFILDQLFNLSLLRWICLLGYTWGQCFGSGFVHFGSGSSILG